MKYLVILCFVAIALSSCSKLSDKQAVFLRGSHEYTTYTAQGKLTEQEAFSLIKQEVSKNPRSDLFYQRLPTLSVGSHYLFSDIEKNRIGTSGYLVNQQTGKVTPFEGIGNFAPYTKLLNSRKQKKLLLTKVADATANP